MAFVVFPVIAMVMMHEKVHQRAQEEDQIR
jgi:hypothetical protein